MWTVVNILSQSLSEVEKTFKNTNVCVDNMRKYKIFTVCN